MTVITRLIVGGAQRIVLALMAHLDRTRFDPLLITGPETGDEGDLFAEARAAGVVVEIEPRLVRAMSPGRDLLCLWALTRRIRRGRFDVVHLHTSKAGFVGSVAARLAGTPAIVYTPHGHIFGEGARVEGVPARGLRRGLFRMLRRAAERIDDRVIALSDLDRDQQVALGLAPRAKYEVISNGVDLAMWNRANAAPREEVVALARAALPANARPPGGAPFPLAAVVGRLAGEKGHTYLFQAMEALVADFPAMLLLVIGDGPLAGDLREEARRRGVADRVAFIGLRKDVPRLLAACDLVVLPSLYESHGLALAEAMALSLPVVGTRAGGVPELVVDGECGLLAPPGDPQALADAIRRLANDPVLAARLAAAGRRRVEARYSLDGMVRRTEDLYERLVTEKRGARGARGAPPAGIGS
ncbi:MAG: glycosyltransferase family 4 protein [Planctomycetes bacterium]|nr:glycosyltransferase family 4 protein [Planctomycetota bacterium]